MKKSNKPKRVPLSHRIANSLDIPEDVIFSMPRICIMGNREMRLENYKTVLEYQDEQIRFACKNACITVTGTSLSITVITDDEVSVAGQIASVTFS